MSKFAIVTCIIAVLSAVVIGSPQFARLVRTEPQPQIPILSRTEVRDANGAYAYSYETGDRTVVNEQGNLRSTPQGDVIVAQGSFSFYSPEGTPYQIRYIADENGFQPQGTHIPVVVQA